MHPHALRSGARELGAAFPAVEATIAISQEQQVEALAAAVRIRREADVSIIVAQPALNAMAQAVAASFAAGDQFVTAHRAFAILRGDLRIPESASGSGDGCPPMKPYFTEGHLSQVA